MLASAPSACFARARLALLLAQNSRKKARGREARDRGRAKAGEGGRGGGKGGQLSKGETVARCESGATRCGGGAHCLTLRRRRRPSSLARSPKSDCQIGRVNNELAKGTTTSYSPPASLSPSHSASRSVDECRAELESTVDRNKNARARVRGPVMRGCCFVLMFFPLSPNYPQRSFCAIKRTPFCPKFSFQLGPLPDPDVAAPTPYPVKRTSPPHVASQVYLRVPPRLILTHEVRKPYKHKHG